MTKQDPQAPALPAAPTPKKAPWHVLGPIAILLLAAVGFAMYTARETASLPAPSHSSPGGISDPQTPGPVESTTATPVDPAKNPAMTGKLGIPRAQCQGFADIAARFWDLKNEGRTLEFAFGVIEQNSAGDAQKQRVLKALAQVVYKNAAATRDMAYRNSFEACLRQ